MCARGRGARGCGAGGFVAEEWLARGWGSELEALVKLLAEHDPRESWQFLDHDPASTYAGHRGRGRADGPVPVRRPDADAARGAARVVEITREFGRLYALDEGERDVVRAMRESLAEGGR
ncbi:hypothetical protein F4809DRAFT_638986 [Biscogniauxia mediterranea]|nr:hypothetical protein F4809DRAFT_638986 [Biscogniauxia mediterranea]